MSNDSLQYHTGRRRALPLVLLALLLAWVPLAGAVAVDSVRLWRAPDHTRLVFDLSAPVEHEIFSRRFDSRFIQKGIQLYPRPFRCTDIFSS